MNQSSADPGSWRDPGGTVIVREGRVFRTVMPCAAADFEFVRSSHFLSRQIKSGRVIDEVAIDPSTLGESGDGARHALEHPRLDFISYPYEWSFAALKAAALLHLDLSLDALDAGVMLSDASAYNIQFIGARPIFIDSLSFRRYRTGEFWIAHQQFCEQFLNPLLLRAVLGVAHNSWYRGAFEGIPSADLVRMLPFTSKLSSNVLTHVVLPTRFQTRGSARDDASRNIRERKLPLTALQHIQRGMREWIARLKPAQAGKSTWTSYAGTNGYSDTEAAAKRGLIAEFVGAVKPKLLIDIGCNSGDYAHAALQAGAAAVIGFDLDQGALDAAFARAYAGKMNFLPLYLDAANPAPSQGWAQRERAGLAERAHFDALIALALVHHLAIARNIPLAAVIDWLLGLAPNGVIEFVPITDPMLQRLLSLRDNVFSEYTETAFIKTLEKRARIVKTVTVSGSERRLFWYRRL